MSKQKDQSGQGGSADTKSSEKTGGQTDKQGGGSGSWSHDKAKNTEFREGDTGRKR